MFYKHQETKIIPLDVIAVSKNVIQIHFLKAGYKLSYFCQGFPSHCGTWKFMLQWLYVLEFCKEVFKIYLNIMHKVIQKYGFGIFSNLPFSSSRNISLRNLMTSSSFFVIFNSSLRNLTLDGLAAIELQIVVLYSKSFCGLFKLYPR